VTIRFYEHVGTAALGCPAEQGSALSGVEVDVFLLHINDKAGFRSETGPTGMRMPRRQVTTIKLKRTPGRRGSQWEAGQVGGSVSATACSIKEDVQKILLPRPQATGYCFSPTGSRKRAERTGRNSARRISPPSPWQTALVRRLNWMGGWWAGHRILCGAVPGWRDAAVVAAR